MDVLPCLSVPAGQLPGIPLLVPSQEPLLPCPGTDHGIFEIAIQGLVIELDFHYTQPQFKKSFSFLLRLG